MEPLLQAECECLCQARVAALCEKAKTHYQQRDSILIVAAFRKMRHPLPL
jgi:hypothetical protein